MATATCSRGDIEVVFHIMKNGADGNCLFYAISQCLVVVDGVSVKKWKSSQYLHASLRKALCNFYDNSDAVCQMLSKWQRDNLDDLLSIITCDDRRMCVPNGYASEMDLKIMAILLNVDIVVYRSVLSGDFVGRFSKEVYQGARVQNADTTIFILFRSLGRGSPNIPNHFEALIPRK
jgi:hypothetical protein